MDALETQRQLDPELDHHTPINALFHDQISAANILVMSKADMMTEADIKAVREKLTRLTKGTTPILEVNTATAPLDAIFGLGLEDEALARSEHAHHHHHDEHDHDDFKTLILSLDAVDDPIDLITAIKQCAEKHGILRIKGFVRVKGKVAPLVVQGVGARVEHYYAPSSRPRCRAVGGNRLCGYGCGGTRGAIKRTAAIMRGMQKHAPSQY